jgi:tetratricopeptide (TPR) repeat protein
VHRRIAQALEVLFADRLDDVSASIAAHLDRGGQPVRAIPFLERAAAVATCVSATEEAIRCLTHAVALVDRLPAGHERDDRELALRATLSGALNTGRGYAAPEIEANLDRVFALLRARDVDPVPVRWLWVASTMRFMLGDLATMRVVSEQALAASVVDPTGRCEANLAMGGLLLSLGRIRESQQYFEAALAAYDDSRPQRALGSDLGVFTHAWYSHALWLLGEEDAAMAHAAEGIALAERRDHLYSQTIAHAYAALMHQMRGDVERAVRSSEEVIARCDRYGFGYYGEWARILTGWARGLERPAEGVRIIEAALERLDQQRAQARRPFYLSLLADTCARLGDTRRTAEILDRAIAMSLERDDVWWLPALYLQKSGLAESGARDALRADALRLSRAHGSRGLEKRLLEGSIASAG